MGQGVPQPAAPLLPRRGSAGGRARGLLQKGWHVIAETDRGGRAVLAIALRPGRARLPGLAGLAVDAIGLPVRTRRAVALRRALTALAFSRGHLRLRAARLAAMQRTLRRLLARGRLVRSVSALITR